MHSTTPRSTILRTALRATGAVLVAALLPLAAAAQTAEDTPTTDAPAEWEVDDRVDRPEEGAMSGTVVLIDRENLILETADGDRAFALDGTTRLPAVLRDSEDWSEVEGFPVEVVFRPGADGELRIVDSLSVLPIESQESAAPEVDSVLTEVEPAAGSTAETAGTGEPSETSEVRAAALTAGETAETADAPAEEATTEDEPALATASALRPGEPGTTQEASTTTTQPAGNVSDEETAELRSADRELPRTASRLPWIGMIGLLALGGAFGLAAVTRKA